MAADNVTSNAGTGGATFRTLSDGTNEWPAAVVSYVTGGSAGAWTLQPVQLADALPVQPGTSTTWAVTQSGTWNITNISGTVSLPTGAATAAKQPTLGTAGSPSTDVLTVQGASSMTALKVDGSGVTQPVSGTVTANIGTSGSLALDATVAKFTISQGAALGTNVGPMVQGSVTTAAPTYTTGNVNPLSLTTAGALRVDLGATGANGTALKVDGSAVTQPVSGTVTANAGSGSFTVTQTTASNLKVDLSGTAANATAIKVDGSTVTQPVSGTVTANPKPVTSGGLTIERILSAATTNATSVKASAGQVYSIYGYNSNASPRFLKLYNKASSPTVGADTPVLTLPLPGNSSGAGFVLDTGGMGIAFGTGIALAITTGVADTDTGAVAANECVVNLLYA